MKPKRTSLTSLAIGTLTLVFSLGGCVATESGNENAFECSPPTVEDRAVALDESTPLGFAGQDVVDRIAGSYTSALDWSDATWTDTHVMFSVALDSSADIRYLNEIYETQDPPPCGVDKEVLVMPMIFTLSTDDGRLDEQWSEVIEVASLAPSEWAFPMYYRDLSELGGTLTLEEHDRVTIYTSLTIGENVTASGRVEGYEPIPEQECTEDSCPGYRPVTADIATW